MTADPNPQADATASSEPEMAPKTGLIREIWALLVVYGTLAILPLLTGIACES